MNDPKPVLYAEDDEDDVFLMERAFGKCRIANPLRNAEDGKMVVDYLAGNPPFNDRTTNPLPCLVLLDLSMPGKHGLEVLKWMKSDPTLAQLPVVVFSSSSQQTDIKRAYDLGADGFLVKPGDPSELQELVTLLKDYWMGPLRPRQTFLEFGGRHVVPPPTKDELC